ncbi:MAG TPA: peptide chain release factor N(5)-glutamine methyltransferase, partial [Hyphomicrobiaceae bacterium]|nr:peptide chain release factor N(5)-glutamine methyltransferase [Hyphomicrobiaceae bacterium]
LTRRLAREPVWRILGQRAFYGLELQIGPAVLDPRPDTETLVDVVLEATADAGAAAPLRILDLGTGSGAILLALLHERPSARGVGVDRSAAALQIARRNGEQLGLNDRVAWIESDWFAGVSGRFDVIVSNPPYIPTGEIAGLDPEVRNHDPRAALDGGGDGLDAYRAIVAGVAQHLAPGGLVAFEIGDIQGPAVSALMFSAGLELVGGVRRDLSERPRVVVARAPVGKSP